MTNSMTCQQFESLVPRLLDGEIEMTGEMRAHLGGCAACQSLIADLRAIAAEAAALPPLEPERDLWSGIAARIEAPVVPLTGDEMLRRGRRHISWRAAGIAAAGLIAVTSAITYQMTRLILPTGVQISGTPDETLIPQTVSRISSIPAPAPAPAVTPGTGGPKSAPTGGQTQSSARVLLANNAAAKVDYDREIMKLRAIVDSGRTRLDPATVALLERNLMVIDTAIVQCRDALAKDPASRFLIESLNNAYQTKVKLLRIAAAASTG